MADKLVAPFCFFAKTKIVKNMSSDLEIKKENFDS